LSLTCAPSYYAHGELSFKLKVRYVTQPMALNIIFHRVKLAHSDTKWIHYSSVNLKLQ